MQTTLQITFENIGHSDPVEARIQAEAETLEKFYDCITSTRTMRW